MDLELQPALRGEALAQAARNAQQSAENAQRSWQTREQQAPPFPLFFPRGAVFFFFFLGGGGWLGFNTKGRLFRGGGGWFVAFQNRK